MTCTVCGKRAYSEFCVAHKPRTAIKQSKPLQASQTPLKHWKRPKQIGKQGEAWSKTRQDWIKLNWSPGIIFTCHYCPTELDLETLTLDHKISRSKAPELRYKLINLVPCCWSCNNTKGSRSHDEYAHNCPDSSLEVV